MITIIYSTHKDTEYNEKFKHHLIRSVGLDDVQILEYTNKNEYSLAEIYNKGINSAKYDIIVTCHNDIRLETGWGKKLLEDFNNNPEFAIIGKAGTCYFPKSGVYWERLQQTMVGQVYHQPEGQKKWLNEYSPKLPFIIPVISIDGLFMAFKKSMIKHQFDESYGKFHFYDHGFCLPNYLDGIKIGVTSSFEITHFSVGQPNQEFYDTKVKFLEKYGEKLPLDLKPQKVYVPKINENKKLKNTGKVAVIIPTKGKLDLLFQCIDSFYEHCNINYFDIFIADTGSSTDEIEQINNYIIDKNIKLIQYDYYNFAKINNDVVKNHIDDSYKYLLFCNNDIKLLNNVIYEMLSKIRTLSKVGTLGVRLHYADNTVQHDGIMMYINSNNELISNHLNKKAYYKFNIKEHNKFGNTAALMMINKNLFNQIGGFNENFQVCFEDLHLNLLLNSKGYINYTLSNCVAYHYESQSRGDSVTKEMIDDYNNIIIPSVKENFNKINNKIYYLK